MKKKRLITSALPYINNLPHLGHMAGSHLPADIFARFSRLKGYDTLFVGGSDEHGTPCEIAAHDLGVSVKELCNVLHKEHSEIYKWFDISYDNYSRTSSTIHNEVTQEVFLEIYKNGYISKKSVEMFYDEEKEMFLPDRYIEGECPECGYTQANGDQCENCTAVLTVHSIKNPKSKLSGKTPTIKSSEHLFLALDKLSDDLDKWIGSNDHWKTQVKSLAKGWISKGLHERGITRDLKNGIKVPLEGMENKVFYVWFDAPIGYVSSTKELRSDYLDYWTSDQSEIYHFLGKDNIPFHTIFWPAIIMASKKYNLPHNVVGMQYLNYEGGKFSKSKGHGIFCETLRSSEYNKDLFRAYLVFLLPDQSDSEFKWLDFQSRINTELIANFCNFVHRSLSFMHSKLDTIEKPSEGELLEIDKNLLNTIDEKLELIDSYLEKVEIKKAFFEILHLSQAGNKYFNDTAPWKVVKEDKKRAANILYLCLHLVKVLAVCLSPYIPMTTNKLWNMCRFDNKLESLQVDNLKDLNKLTIETGHETDKPEILFAKITDDEIVAMQEVLTKTADIKEMFK